MSLEKVADTDIDNNDDHEVNESDDEESEDDLMDDSNIEGMEKLSFDFEAYAPVPDDLDQINNLLTQIFLRTDVDYEALAKEITMLAPLGSVIKTAEDFVDESNEDCMYGVNSVVVLTNEKSYGIADLLKQRAQKRVNKDVMDRIDKIKQPGCRLAFVINERMLHFPPQIAGPSLSALKNDITNDKALNGLDTFLMVLKIRSASDEKKKGKVQPSALTDVVFDNEEESLLFEANPDPPVFFDYPVHSDVESTSKFHVVRRNGLTLRPYRRVCFLTKQQLFHFCDTVAGAFSA